MPRLIKNKEGCFVIEFDTGSFDDWCIFLTRPGFKRYAPRDTEYFSFLKQAGTKQGVAKVYNDFVQFYQLTSNQPNENILSIIEKISWQYEQPAETEMWFVVIYAGMIAEENKKNSKLGKRVKRLGLHQLLLENFSPESAASFSKNKKWQDLDKLMKSKGF